MQNLINKIHLGDCLEFMKQLPDKCIDLVLTDPPYGKGNDEYDSCRRYGNRGGRWEKYKNGKALSRMGGTWAEKCEKKISDWDVAPAQEVFDEIFRVSKHQIIWGGGRNSFSLSPSCCFHVCSRLIISESFSMAMSGHACAGEPGGCSFHTAGRAGGPAGTWCRGRGRGQGIKLRQSWRLGRRRGCCA